MRDAQQDLQEYAGALRRMIRRLGHRGAEGELEALTILLQLQRVEIEEAIVNAIFELRHDEREPWGYIARALGMSAGQAARRFGTGRVRAYRRQGRSGDGAHPTLVVAEPRLCRECGDDISWRVGQARFCGEKCASRWSNRKRARVQKSARARAAARKAPRRRRKRQADG